MKKLKKLLLIAMSAVMCGTATLATACNGGAGGGSNNGTPPPVTGDIKYDEYGDPVFFDDNGKPIELNVWSIVGSPDNAYLDVVNNMFNDYYKESGVSAKVRSIANGEFYSQLANTINTDVKNAPDVVIYHSERLPLLASNNLLRPLDEFYAELGDNNTFSADNYIESVVDECYYNDKLYGVPLDVHSGMWYVRSDILEKNGLEMPSTLTEFVDVCNDIIDLYNDGKLWYRAMKQGGAEQCAWKRTKDFGNEYCPVVMSATGGIEIGWFPQTAVFQNGGTLVGEDGKPAWNTQGLHDVMSMFRDWQTGNGTFNGEKYSGKFVSANNDYNTVWSKLSSGEAIFSFEGPWWMEQRFNEYEEILGDLADSEGKTYQPLDVLSPSKLFALDENSEDAAKVYGVGHCFSICRTVTSKSKCVAAALYAQYMTENSAEYTQGGHLPACKSVLESEKFKSMPCYDRYIKKLGNPDDFVMLGGTTYYSEVYEKLKLVYVDVFTSSKNNVSIQDLIDARYNEALKSISASDDL